MAWRIIRRLGSGQIQRTVVDAADVASVFARLWNRFQGTGKVRCQPGQEPHTARLAENLVEYETMQRMEWLASSFDLIPIEGVWETLERRFAASPKPPVTWRTGGSIFVNNGIVFPKISSIISSYPCKTGVWQY
ncbi:hypothetical protein TNCV_5080361 [Trichonephila clavipes]|nr:hypothetical protein TNCV_5080361 [Trichonephila clavipes]